jgi:hypothetical protein
MAVSFTRRARRLTVAGLATLTIGMGAQFAAAPAAVSADTYSVPLHQDPPITNSGFPDKGDCVGSPAQWGWHFVLPNAAASFVSLTVTFQTAGTITLGAGDFGPPTDQHAYVYTATDDTLLSASAEVSGGDVAFFNLSHVCAGGGNESATPTPTPSESVTPSESASATPTPEVSATETATPTPSESAEVLPTELSATPTPGATVEGVKRTRGPAVAPNDLPSTGTPIPVALLLLLGFGLLASGVLTTVAGEAYPGRPVGRHRR